jgi:hypothetical protein
MANRNATLYIRITKNGRSSFCKPVYQSKGRLKPQYAMVKGEPGEPASPRKLIVENKRLLALWQEPFRTTALWGVLMGSRTC